METSLTTLSKLCLLGTLVRHVLVHISLSFLILTHSKTHLFGVYMCVFPCAGVGKTNFMLRCAGDPYSPAYSRTIGVDFKVIRLSEDGTNVKLQLWDVSRIDRFRSISTGTGERGEEEGWLTREGNTAYYRGAHGIFLLFSVTDRASFNSMHHVQVASISHCVDRCGALAPRDRKVCA